MGETMETGDMIQPMAASKPLGALWISSREMQHRAMSMIRRLGERLISMPSWELFASDGQEYRDSVILTEIAARVAVEEASTFGLERYTGLQGTVLGIHTSGLSAPMKLVAEHFGFEPEHVVAAAREQIARHALKK
jgi:transketolase